MDWLKRVRSALFTALACFLALQLVLYTITPLMPLLIFGLVVVTIGGFVYYRRL